MYPFAICLEYFSFDRDVFLLEVLVILCCCYCRDVPKSHFSSVIILNPMLLLLHKESCMGAIVIFSFWYLVVACYDCYETSYLGVYLFVALFVRKVDLLENLSHIQCYWFQFLHNESCMGVLVIFPFWHLVDACYETSYLPVATSFKKHWPDTCILLI